MEYCFPCKAAELRKGPAVTTPGQWRSALELLSLAFKMEIVAPVTTTM